MYLFLVKILFFPLIFFPFMQAEPSAVPAKKDMGAFAKHINQVARGWKGYLSCLKGTASCSKRKRVLARAVTGLAVGAGIGGAWYLKHKAYGTHSLSEHGNQQNLGNAQGQPGGLQKNETELENLVDSYKKGTIFDYIDPDIQTIIANKGYHGLSPAQQRIKATDMLFEAQTPADIDEAITRGAYINTRGIYGETPIEESIYRLPLEVFKHLIKREDIDLDAGNNLLETLFQYRLRPDRLQEFYEMFDLLIDDKRLDPNLLTSKGYTILEYFFRNYLPWKEPLYLDIFKLLLNHSKINLDKKNSNNQDVRAVIASAAQIAYSEDAKADLNNLLLIIDAEIAKRSLLK